MNRIYRFATLLLLFLLLARSGTALSAGLEASIDRTRIVEGESVMLTVTAPGDSWGIPELGALAQEFEVESQGQSTNMTIVNGQASSTREWRFLLAPKRSGRLTVPALKIGGMESEPIQLEVLPTSEATRLGETLPVMVEAEVDKATPYVQGQVVYTARVLLRVQVQQATLEDPKADGVIIERLGEDRSYETHRDGHRYKVIERRYALFPQHSGPIEIAPPALSGAIAEPRQGRSGAGGAPFGGSAPSAFERFFGRDPFDDMGSLLQRTRPIQVRGPAVGLDVRPQPDGAPSPWLPAESLQLADAWMPDLSELRVGEPITRTIAITAQGLSAAQLPDLEPEAPDGVKRYPDKPRSETRTEGDDLIAVKEIKQALVPSVEGELTLPEIRLAWWDTQADRERLAVLPARVVQVLPAQAGTTASSASPPRVGIVPDASNGDVLPLTTLIPPSEERTVDGNTAEGLLGGFPFPAGYWPWLSAAFGLTWLVTFLLWLYERRRHGRELATQAEQRAKAPAPSLSVARSQIRRAIESNDPRVTREALLAWAVACWSGDPPRRLESLAARFNGPAAEALRELDRHLYASGTDGWDGRAAWDVLKPAIAKAESDQEVKMERLGPLPPLYPQRA